MVAPAATVTLGGVDTVAAEVDVEPTETVVPPEGAGPERVTVHCDEPGAVTEVGVQDKLFSEGGGAALLIVIVAPEAVAAMAAPAPEVAIGAVTWMALELEVVALETLKLAVARVPSAIAFVLRPLARQTY